MTGIARRSLGKQRRFLLVVRLTGLLARLARSLEGDAVLVDERQELSGALAPPTLGYSQCWSSTALTLRSHTTWVRVRPWGLNTSESETMRQWSGSVMSPMYCWIIRLVPIISTLIDIGIPSSVAVAPAATCAGGQQRRYSALAR
jgi:hypothetical protein